MNKLMSLKEAKQAKILEQITAGNTSQTEAARRIGITVRQVHRLNKRLPTARAIKLMGAHYADFGPTLAAQKLSEQHAIRLSVGTVRQQMIVADYWQPKRGSKISIDTMRCRRARFGELIQIDDSPHDWFEGRGAP